MKKNDKAQSFSPLDLITWLSNSDSDLRVLFRFMSYVDTSSDCWLWQGERDSGKWDYGLFSIAGRKHKAHRWLYEQCYGPQTGLVIRHHCDTPACVRLDHLGAGTHKQNTQDMMLRGRHVGRVKALSPCQVTLSRILVATGSTQREVAERFGVSRPLISNVVRGKKAYG